MTRIKLRYVCEACGGIQLRWQGKCPECDAWNTLVEDAYSVETKAPLEPLSTVADPLPITQSSAVPPERMMSGIAEFDRVVGGGLVPGSLTLIGGDPGIGKSTLMLQVSHRMAEGCAPVLYVSGEESFEQARLRADRLQTLSHSLLLYTETQINAIAAQLRRTAYRLVVVDSIQSVYSNELSAAPGSVGQVRECANLLLRLAKSLCVPILLVGHVTKDSVIAGPRLLEHLVDAVLYFEGENRQSLRVLRAVKNRFGSTNEIGVFEMCETGLREVANPSALFLSERPEGVSGSSVFPSMEGSRPLLVEIQALVSAPHAGTPRRTITGMNPNRIALLLAVLEKHLGFYFADRDVFINVAGGVRLDEPAADLAAAIALASSFTGRQVKQGLISFGEVGLSGEIRSVGSVRRRIAEAVKFGFSENILPTEAGIPYRYSYCKFGRGWLRDGSLGTPKASLFASGKTGRSSGRAIPADALL